MRYEDRLVDQVQSANDIADIISGYVPLKPAGRNFKALCPFHQEKTPSFMVNREKQIFHCFGCGIGGDVFSFLMKHERLTFPEALRQLAERVHLSLPEPSGAKEAPSLATKLFEVYEVAFQYYRKNFDHDRAGLPARQYLEKRGFDPGKMGEFGIGYALPEWRGLMEYLLARGYPEDFLLRSGLICRSAQGHIFDLLRSRIIFPIRNAQGKVIAFGGRTLAEDHPKYINSPETEIFRKRREFYGLHLAKRSITPENPRVYVVEGYLDQNRLFLAGFPNTVATLGTALTEDHVRVLKRYVSEAVLVYDGDKAGEVASLRGLEVFLKEGLVVKILSIPGGMDPDQFVREYGREGFERLIAESQDIFDFKLACLMKQYDKRDPLGLLKISGNFLETFSHVSNAVLLDRYIKKLSLVLGVEEDSIRHELAKLRSRDEGEIREDRVLAGPLGIEEKDEITLLGVILTDWSLFERTAEVLEPEEFHHEAAKELFRKMKLIAVEGKTINVSAVFSRTGDEKLKSFISKLSFFDMDEAARLEAVKDCIKSIKSKNVKRQLADLHRRIRQAEASGQETEVLECMKEYQSLMAQMK